MDTNGDGTYNKSELNATNETVLRLIAEKLEVEGITDESTKDEMVTAIYDSQILEK